MKIFNTFNFKNNTQVYFYIYIKNIHVRSNGQESIFKKTVRKFLEFF